MLCGTIHSLATHKSCCKKQQADMKTYAKLFTVLLVCCGGGDARLLWQSPPSISSHSGHEKDDLHALSSNDFGDSHDLTHYLDPDDHSRYVLRVNYAKGSYSGESHRGAQFYMQPSGVKGHDEMTLSYDVYFASNFNWVKGGKLPGLWGGVTTCSGHRATDNCFSTRFMWRGAGDGEVYAYIPHNQSPSYDSWCHASDIICHSNSGQSLGRGTFTFHHSKWQKITQYVKLNTHGNHDGEVKVWYNRDLVYHKTHLLFRNKESIHIDGIFFSTFYGGGDSSWASPTDTYTLFRDFRLYDNHQDPAGIFG